MKHIHVPFSKNSLLDLQAGNRVLLSGIIYTARDAAHKRLIQLIQNKKQLPIDVINQLIYYCGPSPAKPYEVIGAAGPTTSSRMDSFTEELLKKGLKGTMGKGARSTSTKQLFQEYQAVYFAAIGGVAALLSQTVKKAEIIAFPELGAEAMYRLEVEQFPCIVAYDCYGGDVFQTEIKKYKNSEE